jgi:hypothetical protein
MKSYVFRVELVQEEDGRWSAGIPALPGCATWGYTREEALHNIHDALKPTAAICRMPVKSSHKMPRCKSSMNPWWPSR